LDRTAYSICQYRTCPAFAPVPFSLVRSRAGLDVALPMTKAMNKSRCVRLKLLAVAAAIMISDTDCIGLARARSKIDQVTEIIGGYSNRDEAKPIARLRKPLLVESVECADNFVLAVFDELTDDKLIVCEKLAQRFRRGPLKTSLVEIPIGMEKSLLPGTSVRCQLLGRVTTSPHCQLDTVAQEAISPICVRLKSRTQGGKSVSTAPRVRSIL
jgi:hypothetical protein